MKAKPQLIAAVIFLSLLVLAIPTAGNSLGAAQPLDLRTANIPVQASPAASAIHNQININRFYSSEPAPMGITDFGIGPNGAYTYNTSSFRGDVHVDSLKTQNSTGDPKLSIQLNVVLKFTSKSGGQYIYWVQDAAVFNTQDNGIYFLDNVWNMSSYPPYMKSSGISGNGKVYDFGSRSYYAAVASSSLPGNGISLGLPSVVGFEANSSINSQGEPQVNLAYNDGYGWITYDTIVFTNVNSIATDYGFVVDGRQYSPIGSYYDAELIFGGAGNGWNTTNIQSNVILQLEYWNGHNYQGVYNAYNFGSDTLEGIENVISDAVYFKDNGSMGAHISEGKGSLGSLYTRSQVSIINIKSFLNSGSLYIKNATSSGTGMSYPFVAGDVNVTVAPGTYTLSIYDSNNGLVSKENETVRAGQYLPLYVSSSAFVTLTMSYTAIGGLPDTAPTLIYSLNGQNITTQLSTTPSIYYFDPGSQWSVTNTLSGQTQNERWQTYQNSSGTASSNETVNLNFYHQYLTYFNCTVVGGGAGFIPPTVGYVQFGSHKATAVGSEVWADAGSVFSYPTTLAGSTENERWQFLSGQVLNGTVSQNPVTIFYSHQYYLTIHGYFSNDISTSPSSGWYDATSNVILSETNSSGWGFSGWIGTGEGSYTGSDPVRSITILGPITEQAIFLPSIKIINSGGGSVQYVYGNVSGTVQEGGNLSVYVPTGTVVTLIPKPSSIFYSFNQWNNSISGPKLSLNISSPTALTASFKFNYLNISLIVGIPVIMVFIAVILVNSRKKPVGEAYANV